jgi:hypothetical protein
MRAACPRCPPSAAGPRARCAGPGALRSASRPARPSQPSSVEAAKKDGHEGAVGGALGRPAARFGAGSRGLGWPGSRSRVVLPSRGPHLRAAAGAAVAAAAGGFTVYLMPCCCNRPRTCSSLLRAPSSASARTISRYRPSSCSDCCTYCWRVSMSARRPRFSAPRLSCAASSHQAGDAHGVGDPELSLAHRFGSPQLRLPRPASRSKSASARRLTCAFTCTAASGPAETSAMSAFWLRKPTLPFCT